MLVENHYRIISQQEMEDSTIFKVILNTDCNVYNGHFPGEPISPGVCNIQMIRECAEKAIGHPIRITYLKQCRMMQILVPSEEEVLEVSLQVHENNLISSISQGETIYLTMKAEIE